MCGRTCVCECVSVHVRIFIRGHKRRLVLKKTKECTENWEERIVEGREEFGLKLLTHDNRPMECRSDRVESPPRVLP